MKSNVLINIIYNNAVVSLNFLKYYITGTISLVYLYCIAVYLSFIQTLNKKCFNTAFEDLSFCHSLGETYLKGFYLMPLRWLQLHPATLNNIGYNFCITSRPSLKGGQELSRFTPIE